MPKKKVQISFDDRIVNNPAVEALLEKREQSKEGAAGYRKADKQVRDALAKVEGEKPYRIGRFIIAETETPARDVSFSVDESHRLKISVVGEA